MKKKIILYLLILMVPLMLFSSPEGFVPSHFSGTNFTLQANLKDGKNNYNNGDEIELNLAVNKNAFLMIIVNTPQGRTVLLSPSGFNPKALYEKGDYKVYLGTAGTFPFDAEGRYDIQILSSTYKLNFFDETIEQFKREKNNYYTFPHSPKELMLKNRMSQSQEWEARLFSVNITGSIGTVDLHTVPEGAQTYVDGQLMGQTPLSLNLSSGRHEFLFKKEHYKDLKTELMVPANQSIGRSFQLDLPFIGKKKREIKINSFPQGAQIIIDGESIGDTPATVKLSYGPHVISIFKDGYKFFSRIVNISANEQLNQDINQQLSVINTLADRKSKLVITSMTPENVQVKLDGKIQSKTEFEVVPGQHVLEVQRENFERYSKSFSIEPGETKQVVINLLPLKGTLMVNVENTSARVFINGEEMGKTPAEIRLAAGQYQLTLIAPRFKTFVEDIKIDSGEQKEFSIKMENAPTQF